ncbi:hypothetical protein ANCCAN_00801 [Ancylostoma caninum]|uniref:Activin types I and II receptor domain protein n=1 Tax=Ancylostoma caninum TaxID=29170 RepID=A0A368H9G0_ANCCA|nr:hypothetical protein ANCCAN_00801 [Ancylostoma caninum]
MRSALIASLMVLFTSAFGLECYYYRIRADETLTPEKIMKRNCSTVSSACLKIISRNELSQSGPSAEGPSTIEGRCAFTQHECEGRIGQCVSEPPMVRFGITIHEHKCCSSDDLSNTESAENSSILLTCLSIFLTFEIINRAYVF